MGVKNLFSRASPGVEVAALSTDPAQTRATCGVESLQLLSPRGYLAHGYGDAFEDADAVVVTGGTPFYDWDHLSRLIHMWHARRGTPLACFGVGAKRIESPHGRRLTRVLLSDACSLSARDGVSRARLASISGKDVELTGDSALWMEPAPRGDADAVRRAAGVEPGDEMVVVCPRALSRLNRAHYHDRVSPTLIEAIRRSTADVADALVEAGHRVVFLPMHTAANDDDTQEIGIISGLMEAKPATIREPLAPPVAAALLGSASLVVGFRLHSLVLAAAQGVPVVGVGYDEKINGFMEYAGVPDCVVDPDGLREKAFAALGEEGLGDVLSDSCALMKRRVGEEAAAVVESLGLR